MSNPGPRPRSLHILLEIRQKIHTYVKGGEFLGKCKGLVDPATYRDHVRTGRTGHRARNVRVQETEQTWEEFATSAHVALSVV